MTLAIALQALWSHWTYRPLQFFTLLVGLSLATGLWTGVQAINTEARSSYEQARTALLPDAHQVLQRRDGKSVELTTFAKLQMAGWRTSPVLEGKIAIGTVELRIVGVDLVSMPTAAASWTPEDGEIGISEFLAAPYTVIASSNMTDVAADLPGVAKVVAGKDMPADTVLVDIGLAEQLLDRPGEISRLILAPGQYFNDEELLEVAPQLEREANQSAADIDRLTDSFHLNLTAFGLLAFAVGLFIVQGTINLAFEQRRAMCRTLRVMGLPLRGLAVALVLELLAIALVAGAVGVVLGYFIAALLLPDVAATLRGLYGAQVSGELDFRMGWWLTGLSIAIAGTVMASFWSLTKLLRMPILAAVRPRAWALMSRRGSIFRVMVSIALLVIAAGLGQWGAGLVVAFSIVATCLLSAALILPDAIAVLIGIIERFAKRPVSQWFWADTRQQLPGLSLALMALLLALAANIGVSTMVGSFRLTFSGWLDQRLAAELYLRAASEEQTQQIKVWLKGRSDAVLPIWNIEADIEGEAGEIFGVADHATYRENWPIIMIDAGGWDKVARGEGVLINEQTARRRDIALGDVVRLGDDHSLPLVGVYSDYGNPRPQAMIGVDLLTAWYPNVTKRRFAIRVKPEKVGKLAAEIEETFGLSGRNLVDQTVIKQRSLEVFERTFTVTQALNILTLSVAGFAIFTSLLTQSVMRLPQLAPVWALGLTRRQLAGLEFLRALLLAALTFVFALPLGLGLAWLLLAVVNVEAFGWRLPMFVFARDWVLLALYGLIATAFAAAIPARRFSRIAPAELVKVFAHER